MDHFQHREAQALRRIDRAVLGAGAWAVTLLVLGGLRVASHRPWEPATTLHLAPLVPALVLAYAVARRSRVAAVLLLAYIVAWEGSTMWLTGAALAGVFLLVFGGAALFGVLGTFAWHRVEHERRAGP